MENNAQVLTFSKKQQETIRRDVTNIRLEVNEGTPRSGKTTADIFKMANFYLESKDENHLVAAYNQEQAFRLFMDGDGLGLMHVFENNSDIKHDEHGDHLAIYCPDGTEKKIYYKGGGKVSAVGAITGMSLGSVVKLEINLLNRKFVDETFRRTIAAKDRFHLAELNPPSPNDPVLEIFKRWEEAGMYKWTHWTPFDNPILDPWRINELYNENKYSKYLMARDFYGLRAMPEGVIYSMFSLTDNTKNRIEGDILEAFYCGDAGQSDATSFSLYVVSAITHKGQFKEYRLNRVATYYHSGKITKNVKAMSIYAKEIKTFMDWCYNKYKFYYSEVFIDPAAKSLREELHLLGIQTRGADNNAHDVNGVKKGIEVGIERLQNMMAKRQFILIDQEQYDHYYFLQEIGMYVRLDSGMPIDDWNHAMDETRYANNYFYRQYILRS